MNSILKISVAVAAMLLAAPAVANTLVILPDESLANIASARIAGHHNILHIEQNFTGTEGQAGNLVSVIIEGDGNGAGRLSLPNGRPGSMLDGSLLSGGLVAQSGFGNSVSLTVAGSANLFSFVQNGSANAAAGSISGLSNQAAVQQTGQNNIASFSQAGNGNIVNISQTSW